MKARALRGVRHAASGFTLIELLVAAAIFAFVVLAFGALFLAVIDAIAVASAEAFLQSQGTLIEEDITRNILRASALQVAECKPGALLASVTGLIYQRWVQNSSTLVWENMYWCIYQYQRTGDSYALLWRCEVTGLTTPQTCTAEPEQGKSLLAGSSARKGLALKVSNTTFAVASIGSAVATTVDVRFDLDLLNDSGESLLTGARRFGFNTTIRN